MNKVLYDRYLASSDTYQVHQKIKKMNIPDSTVPGDFPPKIWKLYSVELSEPVSFLANRILETGKCPDQWKTEFVTVIPKVSNPTERDELRNLSLTLFVSKVVENILYDLLLKCWGDQIDPA